MSTTYVVGVKIEGSAVGLAKAAKEAVAQTKQMGASMGQEFSKMARARELLGVRSEAHIRQEILKTRAAYVDLTRVGTMSWNDQRRAARAMREEVTRLTNEMGRLTTRQKVAMGFKIGAGAVATTGVAAAMVAPKVRTAMAYDLRLSHLANTAFSDRDKAGRQSGRRELDADISDAVRYGRGTRDAALDTAETLYGSGIFKRAEVRSILREAILAATANNADPQAFAQMAISANQTMGVKPENMGRIFGMGTFAGQAGGFEIKDMAKWLPPQMAAAKAVGMYGERGFAKLAALNQAAVVTAGSKDEAGNNVVNLLAKMGSQDTFKDFKKLGINLPQKMAEGRMQGLDALDVVGNLLQSQLGKDKNYQRVQKELAAAKNDSERTSALAAVGDIAQGTVIGKVFQDRQALMALYAYLNARDRVNTITGGALDNPQAALKNMDLIRETASSRAENAANEMAIAQQKSMDRMLPTIGALSDGLAGVVKKYPDYTTAIVAATGALGWLATMAGVAAFAGFKMPGAGGAAGAATGAAAGAGGLSRLLGTAGKLLGPLGILFALEGVSEEDIARLRAMDARKGGGGSGVRGQGFNDPRLLGGGADAAAFERSLRATEVRGEISVRVTAAPGLAVETSLTSGSPRIPMKAALGASNVGAGY